MFWNKVFVVAKTGQVLMQASSAQQFLDLSHTGVRKVSKARHKWSMLFSKVATSPSDKSDKEFLYLQAHLIDLLELNIELFEKRRQEYKKKRNAAKKSLSGEGLLSMERFFAEDLNLYTQRKSFLIEKSFERILRAKDLAELLEIKAYLISNVALITYKTKQPYYF
ncbi:MAG: hypothetical protein HUU57_04675 [Bdellovibrio sp.]|nr:hypothetical protein [Bdellovibrio sp.]